MREGANVNFYEAGSISLGGLLRPPIPIGITVGEVREDLNS